MKYDVCVFGGCSLDQTFYQKADGTYDEMPNATAPGGKGANQAVAASRANAKTTIITRIGKDEIGKKIINNLQNNNIDTSNVEVIEGLSNDYANIRINIKDKDNDIERFNGAIDSFTVDMIENYKDVLLDSKIIVCQLKCPKEVTEALINFCYENGKTLILTPCRPEKLKIDEPGNLELIDKISMITCNKKECETIFGTDNIEECVTRYPNKLIVTLGSKGLMYHNGEKIVKLNAIDVPVVDTTGAGDTLNGNLSAFLAKGMNLRHALRKAMYASTMKLMEKTAQAGMPYLEDLENFVTNTRHKEFVYGEELQLALDIIKEVYEKVKYSTKLKVSSKEDGSLVTNIDLAIEKYLVREIKKKFPNDNFVTEENFPDNKLYDRTWVIDPIDGTSHFVKKDGLWGIQLAFYDKDETKFSAIYLPKKDELYYAAQNQGAYLNNNKIFPRRSVPAEQAVVEFSGSINKNFEEKMLYLNNLMSDGNLDVANVLLINTCAIAYTNLISGRTDALISSVNRPWDIMPGEFLCKESGLPITYLNFENTLRLVTNNEEVKDILLTPKKSKIKTK